MDSTYTTYEQSKYLLEIGVPANTSDFHYNSFKHLYPNGEKGYDEIAKGFEDCTMPCWTVGRLVEIIEKCSNSKKFYRTLHPDLLGDAIGQIEYSLNGPEPLDFTKMK